MIIDRIRPLVHPGTVIPKPEAKAPFRVKGWGMRRGEEALVYTIPNHRDPSRPYEKGVTVSELEQCYEQLNRSGRLTRTWFDGHLARCASEGSCNFTTVGGVFVLLGEAEYLDRGVYARQTGFASRPATTADAQDASPALRKR